MECVKTFNPFKLAQFKQFNLFKLKLILFDFKGLLSDRKT